MKYKIYLIIVLNMILTINAYAETYYGDYYLTDISDITTNLNEDEYLIKEKKLYNTYNLIYTNLGYLNENNLYIKDENDYIEEYEITEDFIDNSEEYITIPYKESMILTFLISDILKNSIINEIELYYDNKLTTYVPRLYLIENVSNIYDKNLNTYALSLGDNNYIKLVFYNKYDIEKLKLIFYTSNDFNFNISMDSSKKIPISFKGKKHIITFNKEIDYVEYKYGSFIKKYKYIKEEKIPTNNYVEFGDNIIEEDFIIEKEYYKRDKLILTDHIIINDINYNIEDSILYSTNKVITNCNIDYNINGEYYCNFKLNDININKKVFVDITNKENNNVDNDINNNFEENNKTNNNNTNDKNITYQENEYTYEKNSIFEQKNDIVKHNTDKEDKSIQLNDDKTVALNTKNKIKNKYLNIIKFVIIIPVILVEILLYIKKKNNNKLCRKHLNKK